MKLTLDDIRARMRENPPHPRSRSGRTLAAIGVPDSAEFRRIANLPRRAWDADPELSAVLERDGSQTLRALQAAALMEGATVGGLVALVRVGGGKTLISFLIGTCMDAVRVVLVVPAKLKAKTEVEFRELLKAWRVTVIPVVVTYEWLGREGAATWLREFDPDLMILDEGHRAKNKDAAVTKRLARLAREKPSVRWVIMSGTLTKRSINEFAHLFDWALAERSPLPRTWNQVQAWSLAVDEKLGAGAQRSGPGVLTQLFDEVEAQLEDERDAARRALRRRIVDTPGVISTTDARIASSLTVELVRYEPTPPKIAQAIVGVRHGWTRPDGEPISDAPTRWRHAIEVALGFFYRWEPEPPIEWRMARRYWSQVVRHILANNRRELDSELQVARAVARGEYDGVRLTQNAMPVGLGTVDQDYATWVAIRDTFIPNTVPVWLDHGVIDLAGVWAKRSPGIVWCSHVAFARELSMRHSLPYYGAEGKNDRGEPIESARPQNGSIIASIASSGEGRNLQAWSRSLVVASTLDGGACEQLLGRTHRDGQTEDEVMYEWLVACVEQVNGFDKARNDAQYIERVTGSEQKLCYCDVLTLDRSSLLGPRWDE